MNADKRMALPNAGPRSRLRPLSELAIRNRGAVNPKKFPDEEFELFSIPAYDRGHPEELKGSEIGSSKITVEPGDVLISKIIPHIQRVWIVPEKKKKRQIASGEWLVFRGRDIVPEFLRHMLLTRQFHEQFLQTVAGMGGSLLRARPSEVARIEIPVPVSLEEQRRIAAILDKADAIRRKRQEIVALAEDLLKSTYMHTVGNRNPEYPDWSPMRIEQLAEDKKGAMRTGPFGSALLHGEFVEEGVAVLGIDNAVRNRFAWDERRFITREKYADLKRYRVFPGDVIITIMGTTGRSAVVPDDIPEAITTKHLATITCDRRKALPEFLSFAIHSDPKIIRQIMKANKGAIMDGLNLSIIRQLEINVPPLVNQKEFVRALKMLARIQEKSGLSGGKHDDLLASLSQRAFSGEL